MFREVFVAIMNEDPLIFVFIALALLSLISKNMKHFAFAFLLLLAIRQVSGKTTKVEVNIALSIVATVSVIINLAQYSKLKNLKKDGAK